MRATAFLATALAASVANAETFQILIGANTTANASQIFTPQQLQAHAGDTVIFNFTNGTYDLIQSSFAQPCVPLNQQNNSLNGFDTGVRPADNGTSITTFPVNIVDNVTTIWFYENSTCGQGGVGGININESSTETLAGFVRNAIRLNGTNATESSTSSLPLSTGFSGGSSSGSSGTGSSSSPSASQTGSNSAQHNTLAGVALALPLAVAALFL
ncbi:uncharacterized protein PHACADRAFT_259771 [Phanerochaete carnosa HHB-10118-sp]|uniref:Phytocyanin domain-containing protein n=1 Tax=Phanerochaete carnosa (strain HHB-10118-sp) TaxID=650164 RepID=K5W3B7_PHACS|nr:uncharacterized protein PHACADRAFT_259771 [Phanerochaete carnosa HHB-10118-sp]EKM53409.1 hypothetical protein PHACADRAFT_259771 [Phanerochaete carnosa HHB-10118-sp]